MTKARDGAEGEDRLLDGLRHAMRPLHDQVDAAFARFSLADRESYGEMLSLHATVLRQVEPILVADAHLPPWSPRTALVERDLAELGTAAIAPAIRIDRSVLSYPAARLGAVYVLEGSRLGGRWLAGQVAHGLPRAYLAHAHEAGGWQRFLDALDQKIEQTAASLADVCAGANTVFLAFLHAAQPRERDRAGG